jgi:type III secretion protein Q
MLLPAMGEVRAYPTDRWPRVSRRDVLALRAGIQASPMRAVAEGARAAGEWLGAEPQIALGTPAIAAIEFDPLTSVAILIEAPSGARSAIAIDTAIASAIIDRAVGGDGEGMEAAIGPLRELERGVLAYAFARWLAGSELRVAAVLGEAIAVREALPGAQIAQPFAIALGAMRGRGVAGFARDGAPLKSAAPAWMGSLEVELAVFCARASLSARQVRALSRGDVVVPDACTIRRAGERIEGRAEISVAGRCLARAAIEADALRVESVETLRGRQTQGAIMEADVKNDGWLDKVGDAPLTLSLELARFALTLEEIAALAPGEILRTGRPIGEHVALRAGDRVIAIGELVDVEGEVGVRIVELPA